MISDNIGNLIVKRLRLEAAINNMVSGIFLRASSIKEYPAILIKLKKREMVSLYDYECHKNIIEVTTYTLIETEAIKISELILDTLKKINLHQEGQQIQLINFRNIISSKVTGSKIWKGKVEIEIIDAKIQHLTMPNT